MTTLKSVLNRAIDQITEKRAIRLETVGLRESRDYVEEIQKQVESLEEEIENCMDISARIDINMGQEKLSNSQMREVINNKHKLEEKLFLTKQRLEVALRVQAELTGADQTESK